MATSSKAPSATAGKLERLVRMDYSGAYRENDKLDGHLDERITSLTRSAQRRLTERDEELETARTDADMMVRLKEVVNNRQEGQEDAVAIVCSSWRRKSSVGSTKRKMSVATSGSLRRPSSSLRRPSSRLSSVLDCLEEGDEGENGVMGEPPSAPQFPDLKKMSLTERRLAKEREQFSARNLFNVRRKSSAAGFIDLKRRDVSPDSSRTATPPTTTNTLPNNQPSSSSNSRQRGRPRTSPAAYGRGQSSSNKNRGYMRPTTASASRLVTVSGNGEEEDGYPRTPRRPRSRRELQRLVELKVDPFEEEEEVSGRPHSWTSTGDRRQDLLHDLQVGQPRLQARVTAFLRTLEDFTRRDRKTGLEQILEAA